jgi:hypothetical protein
MADMEVECGSSPAYWRLHIIGGISFIGKRARFCLSSRQLNLPDGIRGLLLTLLLRAAITIIFPAGVLIKLRKVKTNNMFDDHDEMVKYGNFFACTRLFSFLLCLLLCMYSFF